MRRVNQVGRHQRGVLLVLVAMFPRPVDARWLAHVASPAGDQTQGNRVLASLEGRGFIARDSIGRSVDRLNALKWRLTRAGWQALYESLPSMVDRFPVDEVK